MTGYQQPETIADKIREFSPIGGIAYSFLGPYIEQMIKDKLGIKNPQSFLNPSAGSWGQSNAFFHNHDMARLEQYTNAMRWSTSGSFSNSIGGALLNWASRRANKVDDILPAFNQMMLNSGVRYSFANPGQTILGSENAGYKSRGTFQGPTEKDLTNAFADNLAMNISGLSKGDQASLFANYARANFYSLRNYTDNRNEFSGYYEQNGDVVRLKKNVVQGLQENIANVNTLKGYNKNLKFKILEDGRVGVSSIDGKGVAESQKSLETLNSLLKGGQNNGIQVSVNEQSGELQIDSLTPKEAINNLQKNVKRYNEAISSWSKQLNTTIEEATSQLNNVANMDITGTFANNYDTLKDAALMSKHINALSGKGNAYTQTAIHAAGAMLSRLGGDRAAAFTVGTQAALVQNRGISYRSNEAEQDAYNVSLQAGFQESDMAHRISAVFGLSGYKTTQEGYKQFERDLADAGLTPGELTMDKAIQFIEKKTGKKVSAVEIQGADKLDAAMDFRTNSPMAANAARQAHFKQLNEEIITSFGMDEDQKRAREIFADEGKRKRFLQALTKDPLSREKDLADLGFTDVTEIRRFERNLEDKFEWGSLKHLGDRRKALNNAAGMRTAEEEKQRVENEKILDRFAGGSTGTLVEKSLRALSNSGADKDSEKLRAVVSQLFVGSPVGDAMSKILKTNSGNPEQAKADMMEILEAQNYADNMIKDDSDIGISPDALREKAQARFEFLIQHKAGNAEIQEAKDALDAVNGYVSTYDHNTGKLTGVDKAGTKALKAMQTANKSVYQSRLKYAAGSVNNPLVTADVRNLFTSDNVQILENGTDAQKEALTARVAAAESFQENEIESRKLEESSLNDDEKQARRKKLAAQKKKIMSDLQSLGLSVDNNGHIKADRSINNLLENNSDAVDKYKRTHGTEMARASKKLGTEPVNDVIQILKTIKDAIEKLVNRGNK